MKIIVLNAFLLTRMLKGAANTLTEIATHIHPRTWTRYELFTRNCEVRMIKENTPMFIEANILRVKFCSQLKFKNKNY